MKKILLNIITPSILLMVHATAMPQEAIYGGVGVSIEIPEESDENGVSGELMMGISFSNGFGVEGKVTKTIEDSTKTFKGFSGTVDIGTVALYGTYRVDVTPNIALVPKIGVAYISADEEYPVGGSKFDETDTNIVLGLDTKIHLSNSMDLYIGLTRFNMEFNDHSADINQVSFGIQNAF